MRISDWSSDVCSSDRMHRRAPDLGHRDAGVGAFETIDQETMIGISGRNRELHPAAAASRRRGPLADSVIHARRVVGPARSEEHTSELQSLMRISYAVLCLKKKLEDIDPVYYYTQTESDLDQQYYHSRIQYARSSVTL